MTSSARCNGGWKVALSVLGKERRMLGSIAIGLNTSLWETRRRVEQTGDDGEAVPGAVGPALVPGAAPALDVAALHLRG